MKALIAVLIGIGMSFFNAWMFMAGVSVVHDHWIRQVPGIGYWWALLTVVLFRAAFAANYDPEKAATR